MTIGSSLFLIAIGAILRYAIEDSIDGVDLPVIGLILIIVGVIGLAIGLALHFQRDKRPPEGEYHDDYRRDPPARY